MSENDNRSLETRSETIVEQKTNVNEESPVDKDDNIKKIAIFFARQFGKAFSVRALYSLLLFLMKFRKSKKPVSIANLFNLFFNMPNLRTSLFFSLMPSIYKLLQMLNNKTIDERLFTFLVGTISAMIGILIEEKTKLTNFIIFSILARLIHVFLNIGLDHFKINFGGKKASMVCFTLISIPFMFLSMYHPSYKPINKHVESYANYVDEGERLEIEFKRNLVKLV
jgi:uncharacterized protein with PQ loop repeat